MLYYLHALRHCLRVTQFKTIFCCVQVNNFNRTSISSTVLLLIFKNGGAEDWDKTVSVETLACSMQWKMILFIPFVFQVRGLPWAWRCTGCTSFTASPSSSRPGPVLTRSLVTDSSGRVGKRPYLSIWNSSNHIKFIKPRSRNGWTFYNVVAPYMFSEEDIQEIQDSVPVLRDLRL